MKSPVAGKRSAIVAGAKLYAVNCASCHGVHAEGSGNIPALARKAIRAVPDGELFWFITNGSVPNGMPKCALPELDRWRIVSYVKTLGTPEAPKAENPPAPTPSSEPLPPGPLPTPPFTDYRFEKPGTRHLITVADLPKPYQSAPVSNGPRLVARPQGAWPKVPAGFLVQLFANGLDNPRIIRAAPNGDLFVAESSSGKIRVFRGITGEGRAGQTAVFATGLNEPYGIAFYPPGTDPQWVYVGDTDRVVRIPYRFNMGAISRRAPSRAAVIFPPAADIGLATSAFSLDGRKLFVGVGSASNVDESADHVPGNAIGPRSWSWIRDGSKARIYAPGIRKPERAGDQPKRPASSGHR